MFRGSISYIPSLWSRSSNSLGRNVREVECTSQQMESRVHSQVISWGDKVSLYPLSIDVKVG